MILAIDTDVLVAWAMKVGAHGPSAAGAKKLLDTALAATLECAGVHRLATFNPSDFAIFGFLDLLPSSDGPPS